MSRDLSSAMRVAVPTASSSSCSPSAASGPPNGAPPSSSDPAAVPTFPFPFEPYAIQKAFMSQLYQTLQSRRVGIFESPTGTGKSLSIICSALTWLKEQQSTDEDAGAPDADVPLGGPAWVQAFARKRKREEAKQNEQGRRRQAAKQQKRVKRYQKSSAKRELIQKAMGRRQGHAAADGGEDSDLIVQDWSGEERLQLDGAVAHGLYSSSGSSSSEVEDEADAYITPKVVYCSRTHTQLNQFVREISRTPFWSDVRIVQLASRATFCINNEVRKAARDQSHRINELCLDMQKAKPAKVKIGRTGEFKNDDDLKDHRRHDCPYMNADAIKLMKDHIHVQSRDIEDLVTLGKKLHACPYYATRAALPGASVVTVPYTSLLSERTRESLGLDVSDCVVVIDEAHNIIETINNVHSCQVSYVQVSQAVLQLGEYVEKYTTRLLPKNKAQIKQLLALLKKFLQVLKGEALGTPEAADGAPSARSEGAAEDMEVTMLGINDFLFRLNIDNINLFEVAKFIEHSEIIRKLNGILEKQKQAQAQGQVAIHKRPTNRPGGGSDADVEYSLEDFHNTQLHSIESFLQVLTNMEQDGRVLLYRSRTDRTQNAIKFMLLNPGVYFDAVTRAARSVVLAGGTMQPIAPVVSELFSAVPSAHVNVFSCGHIVPKESLLAICLDAGPTGAQFDFTFRRRQSPAVIEELGRLVVNLMNVVPDGVVLFFPSYQYEGQVYRKWQSDGIIARIERKKRFFRESKEGALAGSVLQAYSDKVLGDVRRCGDSAPALGAATSRGAVLSCVIGGKMSEGINFSDHLGRCVIVVGLPYAPPNDPVIKEKMAYLSAKYGAASAGEEYYEGLCMKGVNQSIGRAIRHVRDHASVLLVDHRYSRPRVRSSLPQWIQNSTVHQQTFAPAFQQLRNFHASKLQSEPQANG